MRDCYIAAAAGVDLSEIVGVLQKRGLHVMHSVEQAAAPVTSMESIKSNIKKCDLFIAVLPTAVQERIT